MDWRSIATEAASFARRMGAAPTAVLVATLAAVVAVAFLAGVRHGAPEPIELPLAANGSPPPVATTQPTPVRVHLAGAVERPGLYEVPSGYRIGDLLEFAGGPRPRADVAAVNLAELLRDGQQVYLPIQGEAVRVSATAHGPSGAARRQHSNPGATRAAARHRALVGGGHLRFSQRARAIRFARRID